MTNTALDSQTIHSIALDIASRMRRLDINARTAIDSRGGLCYLSGHDIEEICTEAERLNKYGS